MDQQDPMAQETMQNVEPYGASLLRQFHEDCTCLLMEYDGALAPLDNPAVQQFMAEVMKTLERQFLVGAEKLFKKTYKQLPPLDGGEGGPAMTEEGPPPEDGGDMDDVVVEMDEEELPPEMSGEDFPAEVGEEAPAEASAEEDKKKGEKSLTGRKYVDGMGQEMAGGMNSEDTASSAPRKLPTPDEVVEGMQTKKQAKSILFSITPIADGKGYRVVENHGQKSLRADLTVKGINKYLTRFKGSGAKSLLDGVAKSLNAGRAVKFALAFSRKALSKEDYEPAAKFGWREPYSRRGGPRLSNAAASTPAEIGSRTLDETGGQGSTEVIDYHVDDPDANFIGELPVATLDNHPYARPVEMTEEAVRKRADRYMKSICKNCKCADCKCMKSVKSAQDVLAPGEEVDAAALHGQQKAKRGRHVVHETTPNLRTGKVAQYPQQKVHVYDEQGYKLEGNDQVPPKLHAESQAAYAQRLGREYARDRANDSVSVNDVSIRGNDLLPSDEMFDPEELGRQPRKSLDLEEWAKEEEIEHQKPQSNDNQPAWASLFDEPAKETLKLGYEFLTKLSMPEKIDLTDEDRLDAYHLHKMLEPVAVSGAKFLSSQKASPPAYSHWNKVPSRENKQSAQTAEQQIAEDGSGLTMHDTGNDLDGPINLEMEDEGSKYLKSCGHCSNYLKMISREKAFGQPHRDEAGYLAKEVEKMLGALCPQGTKDVGDPSSDEAAAASMGMYELGDLEEKDLDSLHEEVKSQEKQLDSLGKLFSRSE